MDQFINEWLQEGIHGIELTYKVAYDPILKYMPKASNKNIRLGIYTMWPEDCNGVMAEDNINDPSKFCQFNYREYNFLNETANGTIPSNSEIANEGASGPPILPDDEDYGGGSYDYINYDRPTKTARPENMNDGRGDWDWLLKQGADFVITDRPVLMVQYLDALGKRKLETPVITEITLPDCATLSNGTGGTKTFTNVRGMVRKISNYNLVDFFTPDTRDIPLDTNLVIDAYKQFSNGKTREWVRNFINQKGRGCTCADLFADSAQIASYRRFPLYTLPQWSQIYPGYDLYINANWFDVRQPWPVDNPKGRYANPKAPYKEPCTNVFGWWQGVQDTSQKLGVLLTQNDKNQPGSQDYDALILDVHQTLKLVPKDSIDFVFNDKSNHSKLCTSGYIIAERSANTLC